MGLPGRVIGTLLSFALLPVGGAECYADHCAADNATAAPDADAASLLQSQQQRRTAVCRKALKHIPSFVLNLARRKDRLRQVSAVLHSRLPHVQACRIAAYDGKAWTRKTKLKGRLIKAKAWKQTLQNRKKTIGKGNGELTRGAVALILGHALAWEHIAHSEFPFGLVMEDDVDKIHPQLEEFLCNLFEQRKMEDYEVVRLQYDTNHEWTPKAKLRFRGWNKNFYNAGMYVLSREGARKMLRSSFPIGKTCSGQLDNPGCPLAMLKGASSRPVAASQKGSMKDPDVQQVLINDEDEDNTTKTIPDCPAIGRSLLPELLHPKSDG